jgi:hypothetical protein
MKFLTLAVNHPERIFRSSDHAGSRSLGSAFDQRARATPLAGFGFS